MWLEFHHESGIWPILIIALCFMGKDFHLAVVVLGTIDTTPTPQADNLWWEMHPLITFMGSIMASNIVSY